MKILVIDDNSSTRRILDRLLRRFGHVYLASEASQALISCKVNEFDFVISDLLMIDTQDDPIGWLRSIREAAFSARIIVNSANDSPEIIAECHALSIERVVKGDHTAIQGMIEASTPSPSARQEGFDEAAILQAVGADRDKRIEELFRGMGLWDEATGKPDLHWVRERKAATDKAQALREKAGMGFLMAVGTALIFWLISLLSAGFKGWAVAMKSIVAKAI